MRSVRTCRLLLFALLLPFCGCRKFNPIDYRPPWPPPCNAVGQLQRAYQTRDVAAFANLLAPDTGVPFLGLLGLDATETLCLHRRLFAPETSPPASRVPEELWLTSIAISVVPIRPPVDRHDLCRSAANPNGLDPFRWKAMEIDCMANAYFDTQTTEADGRITAHFIFVVIEDLQDVDCVPRQYLLRWEEIDGTPWSDFIGQYQGPCSPGNASR